VLGSADVITAANGTVKEHRSYDAWGQQRSSVWKNALSGPFSSIHTAGYTNQEAEASLNLINMKGRIYDPQLARFMQTDPIVGNPFSSQHWNGYSYVLNNPLKFTDPTGYYDDGPPPPDLPPYAPGEAVDNAGNREVIPHMIVVGDRPRSTAPKSSGGEVTPPSDPVAEATPPNEGPGSGGGFGDLHLSESQAPRAPQYGDDDYIPPGEIHTQHQVDFETRMVVGGSYRDGAGGASLGRLLYKLIFGYQPNSVDLNGALHVAKTATIERQIDRSAAMRAAELAPKDGGCFVAGTLVTTAEAERPIEEVALGERVRTAGDEACDGDGDDADLRRVELELPNADFPGDVVQVSLLRSGEWLRENHVEAGKRVFVALAEMGLAGDAHISSVSEVVRVQPGRGCLVTGTYSRTSAGLRDLRFSGGEAVRATAKHPFWSLDRNDWVPAGELRIGERVKTLKVDHE
jgi:RHS repeat-associated protein